MDKKPNDRAADTDGEREADAALVGKAAHEDAAGCEAEHRQRIGQRGGTAINAEFGLHSGQSDGNGPHADAADRGHEHGCKQTAPGETAINGG